MNLVAIRSRRGGPPKDPLWHAIPSGRGRDPGRSTRDALCGAQVAIYLLDDSDRSLEHPRHVPFKEAPRRCRDCEREAGS